MRHTVVLNSAYQVLGSIPETDAICLITTGKAWAKENDASRLYRAQHIAIPAPTVVILNHYVKVKSFKIKPELVTNSALFRRDGYTCQYCGTHQRDLKHGDKLEREHIIPISRGGKNYWDNIVTACSTCNHKKDDRTPEEAGMTLLKHPTVPVNWTIRGKSKLTPEQLDYVELLLNIKNKGRIE